MNAAGKPTRTPSRRTASSAGRGLARPSWQCESAISSTLSKTPTTHTAPFRNVRFDRARFSGDARFDSARFTGRAGFDRAQFSGSAVFNEVRTGADCR
ncbi:pentapeptide repeat-containing protein [Streptomyces sp. NPDC048045]|uniref:pentapeptide repeat-containing protein n=1 Tax=Streptomyces sp. NPDC048045 TaxID=3154710 RepID=UPI003449D7C7